MKRKDSADSDDCGPSHTHRSRRMRMRFRDGQERERDERGLARVQVCTCAVERNRCGNNSESSSRLVDVLVAGELGNHEEHESQSEEGEQRDKADVRAQRCDSTPK